jgi:hypothetical protein
VLDQEIEYDQDIEAGDFVVTTLPTDYPMDEDPGCDTTLYEFCYVFRESNQIVMKLKNKLNHNTKLDAKFNIKKMPSGFK